MNETLHTCPACSGAGAIEWTEMGIGRVGTDCRLCYGEGAVDDEHLGIWKDCGSDYWELLDYMAA